MTVVLTARRWSDFKSLVTEFRSQAKPSAAAIPPRSTKRPERTLKRITAPRHRTPDIPRISQGIRRRIFSSLSQPSIPSPYESHPPIRVNAFRNSIPSPYESHPAVSMGAFRVRCISTSSRSPRSSLRPFPPQGAGISRNSSLSLNQAGYGAAVGPSMNSFHTCVCLG